MNKMLSKRSAGFYVFVLIFTFFYSSSSYGQSRISSSQLWKIEGNGLQQASYILATIPIPDSRTLQWNDTLYEALNQCAEVAIGYYSDLSWLDSTRQQAFLMNNQTLENVLNSHKFSILQESLLADAQTDIWDVNHLSPLWIRQWMETNRMAFAGSQNPVEFIKILAREQGKKVSRLASASWFLSALAHLPAAMQGDLMMSAFEAKNNPAIEQSILNHYLRGDLSALKADIEQHEHAVYFDERYVKPVTGLAVDMQDMMHKQAVFFLLDAAMLPGKSGLIARLQKMGYTLEPVNSGLRQPAGDSEYAHAEKDSSLYVMIDSVVYYPLNTEFDKSYFRKNLPGWYPITSFGGGFTAFLPEKPVMAIRRQHTANSYQNINLFKFEDKATNRFNTVSYSDYPQDMPIDVESFFDELVTKAVSSIGGILLVETNIGTSYLEGRDIEVAIDEDYYMRARFYLADNRLYQIMLGGSKQSAYSKQNEAFLNSLHIMNQKNAPWFTLNLGAARFELPDRPKEDNQSIKTEQGNMIQYRYQYLDGLSGVHYLISVNNYPDASGIPVAGKLYNQLVFSTTDQVHGFLLKDQLFGSLKYSGRYAEIAGEDGQYYRALFLLIGQQLYQVLLSGSEEVAFSNLANRVFQNITLGPFE